MSPALALEIVEFVHDTNKELYRAVLASVAEARRLRPMYFERTPKAQRHAEMVSMLTKPRLELTSAGVIREWLMKKQTAMLADFLDALAIPHKDGAVEDLPASMADDKLKPAVEQLLAKYKPEEVAVYLNAFYSMNDVRWPNLESMLNNDPRLQFGI
jgi:hypothetical protein